MKKLSSLLITLFLVKTVSIAQTIKKVDPFQGLSVSGNIDVKIVPTTGEVKVEYEIIKGDDEDFKIEVKNNNLKLRVVNNDARSKIKVKATVFYDKLSGISTTAGSSITNTDVLTEKYFSINAESGSNINLFIKTTGLSINSSSGATITLRGNSESTAISASSGSNISARDLIISEASVSSSSGSNIVVHVTNNLTASTSSGGSISYKGEPKNILKDNSSGGSISKIK